MCPYWISAALASSPLRSKRSASPRSASSSCLSDADGRDGVLFVLPVGLHAVGRLAQVGQLFVEPGQPLPGGVVGLLGQRHALDLELADAPVDHVDLGRHGLDLDAQAAGGLVDQVDGLVGQEPAGDVAVGQDGRRHQGGVHDPHPVVHLVALLQAPQDGDGVLDRRLADVDRLEAPLQGGVLLDVLAVLVEGRGPDHAQLASGQHRLDHVAGVHGAFGRPGADDGVQLVDEGDDLAPGVGDLLEHRLQPLLELAPVLGAGHHGAEVEGQQALAPQAVGHVALDDAAGQALHDGRLADAGLADEHRVVLGPPGEDLDHPPDLLVAADDRVELAAAGVRGQVPAVLLQRLVASPRGSGSSPGGCPAPRAGRPAGRRGDARPGRPGPAGGARPRGTRRRGPRAPLGLVEHGPRRPGDSSAPLPP